MTFHIQEADPDQPDHPQGWFGVVDEDEGGVIAWFSDLIEAQRYLGCKTGRHS